MGATLNIVSSIGGHTLSDRGTWLHYKNKKDLKILFEGGDELHNPYSFLPVNPKLHKHTKSKLNEKLEKWLIGNKAQRLIESYKVDGQQLFKHDVGEIEKSN